MNKSIDEEIKQGLKQLTPSELQDFAALVHFLNWRKKGGYTNPFKLLRGAIVHFQIRFMQLIGKV